MKETRIRLLHMHYASISRRVIIHLLLRDPSLSHIYSTVHKLQSIYSIPYKYATTLHDQLLRTSSCTTFKQSIQQYDTITIMDEDYPRILKQIKDPPIVLYVAGNKKLLAKEPLLSVIGSRQPTPNAWKKVAHIVPSLIDHGWVIVSGMAKGIDSYAHTLSIRSKGNTIAVLGGGFHHIYPKQHESLFYELCSKGLVLSEYPPNVPPRRYHFPERNRIISGLSFGTLVIEAKKRSGTMITVDQALDQGREVYAIPGSPFEERTAGCNQLIQEGAKLTQHPDDIIEDWTSFGERIYSRK